MPPRKPPRVQGIGRNSGERRHCETLDSSWCSTGESPPAGGVRRPIAGTPGAAPIPAPPGPCTDNRCPDLTGYRQDAYYRGPVLLTSPAISAGVIFIAVAIWLKKSISHLPTFPSAFTTCVIASQITYLSAPVSFLPAALT